MKTRQCTHRVAGLMGICLLAFSAAAIRAETPEEPSEKSETLADKEMKPTEFGVRFTPGMARAIGIAMTKQMKPRYELSDEQVESVQEVISRQMMHMVHDNAKTGRDMFEFMLETSIANRGSFPAEDAIKFAEMAKPIMPALREFFKKSAGEIGKKLTIKQKLKLTGDMAVATAGLVVFENRMKRWEEGKVGAFANPFYDSADNDPPGTEPEPEDPNEHPEHRKARKQVESWIDWQINVDRNWEEYVEQAITFYDFDEAQIAAAKAILKDCKKRAEAIKTKKWRSAIKENRILRQMARSGDAKFTQGPWMYNLERAYKDHLKPLEDLGDDMKRRIEGLPTSSQRSAAREEARKIFAEKGVKQLPI